MNEHGLIIGGPFDGQIETDERFLADGFQRGHKMRWHQYTVYTRPDGTKFFLYSGVRDSSTSQLWSVP